MSVQNLKLICFLAAWGVPSAIWLFTERTATRRREHNEARGRRLKNPVFWARTRQAKKIGAGAFVIVLFALQSMTWHKVVLADDMILSTMVFLAIALGAYKVAFRLTRGSQDVLARASGEFDDGESLTERDNAYLNEPVGPPHGKEHGGARQATPGQLGLAADTDVLKPVRRKGAN